MVSHEKEDLVLRLAAGGLTERQIEQKSGVSRNTIRKIIKKGKAARDFQRELGPHNKSHEPTPIRCPNCRYVVVLPCVVCGYRKKRKPKPNPYRDNLFLHIKYASTAIKPHSPQDEDDWDDAYERRCAWMRSIL